MSPQESELKKIEKEVRDIRDGQSSLWYSFRSGVFYGAGWIVGTILAVTFVSYLLSLFHVIPGLDVIATYISNGLQSTRAPKL